MKKLIFLLTCLITLSCSSDDNCLRSLTGTTDNIPRTTEFKEIYSDNNYKINITKFMTPNGDGINDTYKLYIEDLSNNTFYINGDFGVTSNLSPNTTDDPTNFFSSISLMVSNDCSDLYNSTDINDFSWLLDFNDPVEQGNYNIEFTVDMTNGRPITVSNNFDLYYPQRN